MSAEAMKINEMLETLETEDVSSVIQYIEFLSYARKNKRRSDGRVIMQEISEILEGGQVWDSEDEMLAEMAEFRRARMSL